MGIPLSAILFSNWLLSEPIFCILKNFRQCSRHFASESNPFRQSSLSINKALFLSRRIVTSILIKPNTSLPRLNELQYPCGLMRFPRARVIAKQFVEDLAFKGGKLWRAALAGAGQIHGQVQHHLTMVDQDHAVA
jgi:hypothetical protein